MKSLGKIFEGSLKDTATLQQARSILTSWLSVINKSGIPVKFKVWIYQHRFRPRLLWPHLANEVPMTKVEGLEKTISQFLCRWFGLPGSLCSSIVYGNFNKLWLPFSSLVEEFMVTRARELMSCQVSSDVNMPTAEKGTLKHILSCCSKTLGKGRYYWYHDQVLRSLADIKTTVIQCSKSQNAPKRPSPLSELRRRYTINLASQ